MSTRARALPPAERRAALVDSARRLITSRGTVPSTKDIAEAAGIAEGTIFRVFATKEDLLDAVVVAAFCPAVFRRGLDEIDVTLPLRPRLVALVTLLQHRFTEVFGIMGALGLSAPPQSLAGLHAHCTPEEGHVEADGPAADDAHRHTGGGPDDATRTAYLVERFVAPDADLLRCTPAQVITYLRLLTFSGSHRHITGGEVLLPAEIVDVVLSGVQGTSKTVAENHCPTTELAVAGATHTLTRTRKAR